jgi:hypothetical protein
MLEVTQGNQAGKLASRATAHLPPRRSQFPVVIGTCFPRQRRSLGAHLLAVRTDYEGGGHVVLADGHVLRVDFNYATTNRFGTRDPNEPNADWNHPDLIWNPRGPAVEGPVS